MASLVVDRLTFSYRSGGDPILHGLDHSFAPRRLTAVTGPSGRGKSTLLYLLGLLLQPASGHVVVDGTQVSDLADIDRSRLRARRIGFVFQDAMLDPTRRILDSVIEPALHAGGKRSDAIIRAESLLGVLGVDARFDHRPGQISGGQAQRVALARALVNRPDIVLADEPTGNLDATNAAIVLDTLRSSGATVVIATHDPIVVAAVDEVLEL